MKNKTLNEQPQLPAYYDSMIQMSRELKIPVDVLKDARAQGCNFVSHGRCDPVEFYQWYFSVEQLIRRDMNLPAADA